MGYELKGLTYKEVEERKLKGKYNKAIKNQSKSIGQIIISNTCTFFNLIFLIIAIIMVVVKLYKSLTFLPLIITNTLIGIIQEIKSKKVLDKLTLLHEPKALVIRNGKEEKISIFDLVEDDLVVFKAGSQISADAVVVAGEALVNESLLTGEPDEIKKEINSDLLSGSYIVSGKVIARVTHVGEESYINKLTIEAKSNKKKEDSEIISSLNRIVKVIGIIVIPFGIALFLEAKFAMPAITHEEVSYASAVNSTFAALLMMIPEGLYLLSSVSLAISAYLLAKKQVLLHNMKSIETLARVNVLCIDKTGTITDNHMVVNEYEVLDDTITKEELYQRLCNFSFAQDNDNITMEALKKYFKDSPSEKFVSKSAFSSSFKYSGVNFKDYSYILGAPELLLKDKYDLYKDKIEKWAKDGYRVLVICKYSEESRGEALTGSVNPFGIVILSNPIRENAVETFKYFESQGVTIKVISGDSPITVSNVAKKACIKDSDKYIDTSTLSDEELIEASDKYAVFGRVSPHAKQVLVKALKNKGKKVAMTGDGVNDVLALKEADCSIAMASGADAAMQTSQVVLLDSDFSKMPHIVYEGRRVVNNLEKSGALFLSKNVFAVLLSLLFIICVKQFPVKTTQVGLINLFTIGAPAFLLSQVANKDIIKGRFITNTLSIAIPAGVTDAVMVALMYFIGINNGLSLEEISTASTLIMGTVGILILIKVSHPYTKYKVSVTILCILGLVLNFVIAFFIPIFKYYYDFVHLPIKGWVIFGILAAISILMYILLDYLIKWFGRKTKALDKIFK